MSEFLESLKKGLQESQAKFQAAQLKMNAFQAEFQAAAQEFQAWQTLVRLETAKEQGQSLAGVNTAAIPSTIGNKTEAVRELLRQHPAGMTPSDIWKELQLQFSTRAYLYSVLKRLRDRGDARERRGKYYLNPKSEEQGQMDTR